MHQQEVEIQPNVTVRMKTNAELLDEVRYGQEVIVYGFGFDHQ